MFLRGLFEFAARVFHVTPSIIDELRIAFNQVPKEPNSKQPAEAQAVANVPEVSVDQRDDLLPNWSFDAFDCRLNQ